MQLVLLRRMADLQAPLVEEALRDCLTEAMDAPALAAHLGAVARGEVRLLAVDTRQPQQLMCFVSNELLEDFEVSPDGKLVAISIQRTLNILPFDTEVLKNIDSRFSLLALRAGLVRHAEASPLDRGTNLWRWSARRDSWRA